MRLLSISKSHITDEFTVFSASSSDVDDDSAVFQIRRIDHFATTDGSNDDVGLFAHGAKIRSFAVSLQNSHVRLKKHHRHGFTNDGSFGLITQAIFPASGIL